MNVNPEYVEGVLDPSKKNKFRKVCAIALIIVLMGTIAFVAAYCSEKGKQQAVKEPTINQIDSVQSDKTASISQHTEGENSPAIVSDNVTVNYGPETKKPQD